MIYDEFKTFLVTHLWKTGDSQVIANLDNLIMLAEIELNRLLKVEDRTTVADISVTSTSQELPADFQTLRHCSNPLIGDMRYNTPAEFLDKKANKTTSVRDFTVAGNLLRTIGSHSVEAPLTLELWYYRKVIRFIDNPTGVDNWMVDNYFDVYLYCVLKHTAPFLREDERLQVWGALFNSALTTALNENDEQKYAGSPLRMKFNRSIR
jgi:hypothetical protein